MALSVLLQAAPCFTDNWTQDEYPLSSSPVSEAAADLDFAAFSTIDLWD